MKSILFGTDRYHEQEDMKNWCVEQFGRGARAGSILDVIEHPAIRWTHDSRFGYISFDFKSELDYTWFALRWL